MVKFLSVFFAGVITSLYFFPFEFFAFPGLNTKMAMAVVGVFLCLYHLVRKREFLVPKEFAVLSLVAFAISLTAYFSVVFNETPDYVYVSYFISMWVWLSAAYVVCVVAKKVHRKLTIELLSNYLIAVCVAQCIMAIIIDYTPAVKAVVDTYINQDQTFLNSVGRLYGIGAWLDVAGTRFSVCLVIIAFMLNKYIYDYPPFKIGIYILAYIIITVLGNMIARTTTVGNVISLAYLFVMLKLWRLRIKQDGIKLFLGIMLLLLLIIPVVWYFYNTNAQFKELIRYAFEGFFNYFERGAFRTGSTDILKEMYVFPDNFKTWIIGDGYYTNPFRIDPYYVSQNYYSLGYYMLTDVGYLRFIFYFGLIGMLGFVVLIVTITRLLIKKFPGYKHLFLLFMLVNLSIWLKVSTDIFLVFALFLCIPQEDNEDYDKLVAIGDEDTV